MAEIFLSILEYEANLEKNIPIIKSLLNTGLKYIHVDIMEKPFIPERNAFPFEKIEFLYKNLEGIANFDFHIMSANPDKLINQIKELIPLNKRKNHYITLHREAYRNQYGDYASKEYDLLNVSNRSVVWKFVNETTGCTLAKRLHDIKTAGFSTGIALEPNTSLENLTENILKETDMILLMSVISGKGGQEYIKSTDIKIKNTKSSYINISDSKTNSKRKLAVDGGINPITIKYVHDLKVDYIIVGSAITKNEDPIGITKKFITYSKK